MNIKLMNTHFQSSLREVDELSEAYAPYPSFDDMAWYALAYTRVHELYHLPGFLRVAKNIFHWNWNKGMALLMLYSYSNIIDIETKVGTGSVTVEVSGLIKVIRGNRLLRTLKCMRWE